MWPEGRDKECYRIFVGKPLKTPIRKIEKGMDVNITIEVGATDSGSCPMTGFRISGV
jgi:hypothetical protein